MKGVIFNAVEAAVVELYSEDVWDDLLAAADLEGHYTSLGEYDDTQLLALVAAGCEATGFEPDELVKVLGRHAFPHLAGRYPELVDATDGTHSFLRSVNDIIHPEVLKLHPDAKPPAFDFEDRDDNVLRVTYRSERRLGPLAEGLIVGAGDRFNEEVEVTVVSGMGEPVTVFDVKATRLAPAPA